MIENAIILAAGMGTRLGKYTENLPKGMLNFNGKPLIQWQVDTLRSCGINDIIIVKGYEPDKINIEGVKYYENKDYANTNMVETLMEAEDEMDDEILVCYADILYEKEVIEKIKMPGKKPTNVEFGGEDMYWLYITEAETGAVYQIRRDIPGVRLFWGR